MNCGFSGINTLAPEFFSQKHYHAGVLGHTAGENDISLRRNPIDHTGGSADHTGVQPPAISRRLLPLAIRDVTSDSANTVHMLEILRSLSASSASLPNSSMSYPRVLAMISRNLPVPAAHRSFISNFFTLPFSNREMALLSCPPISKTVWAVREKMPGPLWHGL
jgi:hypothetical protein